MANPQLKFQPPGGGQNHSIYRNPGGHLPEVNSTGGKGIRLGLLFGFIILTALMLSACNIGQEPSPTPDSAGVLARPPKLPTRPPTEPAPTPDPSPTVVPTSSATASPETSPIEDNAKSGGAPSSGRLPGAYVRTTSTTLAETPGGRVLARIPAGARLGILEQSDSGAWLKVHYQPDPKTEAQTGWVRASHLSIFADLDDIGGNKEPVEKIEGDATAQGVATVLANRLNMRAGPGTDQQIVGALKRGEQVQLLGRSENSEWLQVQMDNGEIAWAAARWLDPTVPADSLPVTGSATTAVPRPTGARGQIVFQTRNGGDIYIINANGSGLRRLTYGFDPALSPDGKQIAFTRFDDPPGLWVINVDGSGQRRLFGTNRPRSPTWTSDGQSIIFERNTDDLQCLQTPIGCYTEEQIRKEWEGKDCWTYPFGTYCISDFALITIDINGLLRYDLTDGGTRDLPSANNAYAPYHHPRTQDVLHSNRDGLATTKDVGNDPPTQRIQSTELGPGVYSPDGQFIYTSRRSGDHWDIWRYRSDGSSEQALTAPPGIRDAPIHNVSPTISPDGRSILFVTNRRGKWELWIMNSDGGNPRPFASQALANIDFHYSFARERMADWGS